METEPPGTNQPTTAGANREPPTASRPGPDSKTKLPRWLDWRVALAVVIAVVVLFVVTFWKGNTRAAANPDALTTVAVAKVDREDLFTELTRDAEFRPYAEVELHAKVSGYVDQMNVDFGDKVKAGQLLATIEVPELLDELHSAIAVQQKAEADYTNANLAYTRLVSVNRDHPNLVAQQDLDTAESKDLSASAAIAAAKADVERYETLVRYTKITAPFDGVVTRRYADPGALIQSGTASDTQSLPLVRVSDNYRLRLDIPVPVQYVQDIHVDNPVDVRVESLGGRTFTGKISRFTDKVDEETRTMIAEVEVDNPGLELVPGMYATVILRVGRRPNALAIPIQAVAGDTEKTVCLINRNQEIEIRPVTLGLETPEKYEVTSGLEEGELVMIGNRSLIQPGQKVQTKTVDQLSVR
jgi:RND family efflux transporter MFP subunit